MNKKSYNHYNTKKQPMIVMSQSEFNRIKKDIQKQTIDELAKFDAETMLTCFATVLRQQYGWGYKRIFKALNSVDEMFGRVLNDELSVEDMIQQLEDEVGIRINCDGGKVDESLF